MSTLLMVGIIVLAGLLGAKAMERIKIPMVVGYIIAGVLIGDSGLKIVDASMTGVLTNIALGFIGFGIGSQLRYKVLKSLGWSVISISFFEAFGAFILVGIGVTLLTGKAYMGLIFGALASATAPAATVDVLEEYRSKGPLTTTLLAVVGIDDGIALLLYGFGLSIAKSLLGEGGTLLHDLVTPLMDIGGAVVAGVIIGLIYTRLIRWMNAGSDNLILIVGCVIATAGIADFLGISLIMTNMVFGITFCNLSAIRVRRVQDYLASFTPPIYVLFFVLVGARLKISLLPQMGLLGLLYIILRAGGKFSGAYFGAKISNAPKVVQKYLGLGLFSQAGVAVGLSLAAANILNTPATKGLGDTVINVIAATTFVVQIIGPPLTKVAIIKSGEADKEILAKKGMKKVIKVSSDDKKN
ncbi:MAG: cation:proton antiporter [Candidatus Marinimicrobia bacterium]|nr:cation:proton antiporter [Candidatus Neomarinimicrobiota bacterium]